MKLTHVLTALLLGATGASCIQDEALNVEAAIDGCSGANILLTNINPDKKTVDIYIPKYTDLSKQELKFTLADNASIAPVTPDDKDNPPLYNFESYLVPGNENQMESYQRKFRVISESQTTETIYNISLLKAELPTHFTFENLEQESPFHILYEKGDLTKNEVIQWASGNPGFKFSGGAANPLEYPTIQDNNGRFGRCVTMITRYTTNFGENLGMPIAAGNLFIGSFDALSAIGDALKATLFGFPFMREPVRMTGWYKYKAGPVFTDKSNNTVSGITDKGDIYAVLYEAPTPDFSLDGDLFTPGNEKAKNIVSLARIPQTEETNEWKYFDLEFKPQNNKTIDPDKLKDGKYKLAVVFSSSIRGAYFEGAVGSRLSVDEVTIECKEQN